MRRAFGACLGLAASLVVAASCTTDPTCFGCEDGGGGSTSATPCGTAGPCDPGETCCSGACVDLAESADHCGACDSPCSFSPTAMLECIAGECMMTCLEGRVDCNAVAADGCEADILGDRNNCGDCGEVCVFANATAACVDGECALESCATGFDDCDPDEDGCETNIGTDPQNCNGCGQPCVVPDHRTPLCLAGTCAAGDCLPGFGDCDTDLDNGCETNLYDDSLHCGVCDNPCPALPHATEACVGGTCDIGSCDLDWDDCDQSLWSGCETDLTSNESHCGACNFACQPVPDGYPACVNEACVLGGCDPGYDDCYNGVSDGCETDLASSVNDCGACGNPCPAVAHGTPGCAGFACIIDSCDVGWDDCFGGLSDGCETDLESDVGHCSGCGSACPDVAHGTRACVNGSCAIGVCDVGWDDCFGGLSDGCETPIASDPLNCGGCSLPCPVPPNAAPACSASTCGLGPCDPGYASCDGVDGNGCERSILTDAGNCGGCGITCGSGSCVGGACVCNTSVLLIRDDSVSGSAVLATTLGSAGFTVTQTAVPSYQYDGTNPALAGFGSVVLLAGGPNPSSYSTDMPAAGQTALGSFVTTAGNGLVLTEWAAYQIAAGRWQTLAPLVLLTRTAAYSGQTTYEVDPAFASHPIWAGLPASFVIASTSNVGTTKIAPYVTRAAGSPQAIDAVALLDAPVGRVAHIAHAGNYAPNGWSNPDVQQLVANAVGWVARCP